MILRPCRGRSQQRHTHLLDGPQDGLDHGLRDPELLPDAARPVVLPRLGVQQQQLHAVTPAAVAVGRLDRRGRQRSLRDRRVRHRDRPQQTALGVGSGRVRSLPRPRLVRAPDAAAAAFRRAHAPHGRHGPRALDGHRLGHGHSQQRAPPVHVLDCELDEGHGGALRVHLVAHAMPPVGGEAKGPAGLALGPHQPPHLLAPLLQPRPGRPAPGAT